MALRSITRSCACCARCHWGMTPLEVISLVSPRTARGSGGSPLRRPTHGFGIDGRARLAVARVGQDPTCGPAAIPIALDSRPPRGRPPSCPHATPVSLATMRPPMPCTPFFMRRSREDHRISYSLAVEAARICAPARALAHYLDRRRSFWRRPRGRGAFEIEVSSRVVMSTSARSAASLAPSTVVAAQSRGTVLEAADWRSDHDGAGAVGLGS